MYKEDEKMVLVNDNDIKERWRDYFNRHLNGDSIGGFFFPENGEFILLKKAIL